ncbi:MAG TPA: tRNA (adenosine(37)-N6)-dimethylallyltransferase MiaA [Candidatus Dormibacteraeota bacterium]|nr:tRNA (adenosine(37)-N6)-dimethylallyltransferase MiaA [Candidatus Dormibacteraeota bacterium]
MSRNPPLIAILGPTASGKSALAMHLAQEFHGEILACDSTQLYRGFDIGTGKPSKDDRRAIPHHLLDVLNPGEDASAGAYREMAIAVLEDLPRRGKLPILTVGTGLYMRALFEGLADLPQRSEEVRVRLRGVIDKHGPAYLHRLLKHLDRDSAARIAAGDIQKLIRAIEVCVLARKPLTQVHSAGRNPLQGWQIIKIGLNPPREELYARIHARIDNMLAAGWQEEVRRLTGAGGAENSKPFDFLGYKELRAVQRHELTLSEARAAIQQSTRRYAKRQQTWFRRETPVHWFTGFGDDPQTQKQASEFVGNL